MPTVMMPERQWGRFGGGTRAKAPLDQRNSSLGVFGKDQQDILRAKHAHCLLDRRSLVGSLQEDRRNRVSGGSLAKMLQALSRPAAVSEQHTAVPPQKPPNFKEILSCDIRHGTGDTDLSAGAKIRRSSKRGAQEPGRHRAVHDDGGGTEVEDVERARHRLGPRVVSRQSCRDQVLGDSAAAGDRRRDKGVLDGERDRALPRGGKSANFGNRLGTLSSRMAMEPFSIQHASPPWRICRRSTGRVRADPDEVTARRVPGEITAV